ncbi:hypothetical protein [Blastococcus saxobsidens]|uniref:TIGR02588 family protein n=1 Tax=Blastococcus saxobsidens (strain DD2) TaxID=1146883 RepID=H6RN87_BLASD|nr:hypothetical protein [Blastococcus saxobsidens]CCG02635.1 Conserved protein of unknown function [Blastococcus saxobsidens DD2]
MSGSDEDSQDQGSGGTSAAEYAVGGLGGLLVLLLIAFLGYQALAVRESGPQLAVEVTAVEQVGAGYEVRLRVRNDGGTTAEAVQVSGQIVRDGRQVEQASATIAYVPPESRREAVLVFSADPRDGELTVGPEGYTVS